MSNMSTITAIFEEIKKLISNMKEADQRQGESLKKLSQTMNKLAEAINVAFDNQRELRDILNRELPLCRKPKPKTEVYVIYMALAILLIINLYMCIRLL